MNPESDRHAGAAALPRRSGNATRHGRASEGSRDGREVRAADRVADRDADLVVWKPLVPDPYRTARHIAKYEDASHVRACVRC